MSAKKQSFLNMNYFARFLPTAFFIKRSCLAMIPTFPSRRFGTHHTICSDPSSTQIYEMRKLSFCAHLSFPNSHLSITRRVSKNISSFGSVSRRSSEIKSRGKVSLTKFATSWPGTAAWQTWPLAVMYIGWKIKIRSGRLSFWSFGFINQLQKL